MKAKQRAPVPFTHLGKVFWPKEGYTKGDVIEYYRNMARTMLPYLKDRPMVLNRHPDGIAGEHFFQKNVAREHLPRFVKTKTVRAESTGERVRYVVCDDVRTLLWLANFGCIEINPWSSRSRNLQKPDFFIADLDPEGAPFASVVAVARELHRLLRTLHVKSLCKTSGKRGLHVYVPLSGRYHFEDARRFGKLLAIYLHERLPTLTSLEVRPSKRRGKVHFDYMRNALGQTAAAAYSLRPSAGATVSTPLEWTEVRKGLDPKDFTIRTIFNRLKKKGDLWKPVLGRGADLKYAIRRLEKEVGESAESRPTSS